MNDDYNTELAVGVAAAAYIINSLVEDEARHRIKIRRSAQDTISGVRSSDRVTMRYSSKEIETAGETSSRKQMEKEIDKLRASRSAISAADISNDFTLGVPEEPFTFSQCRNKVTVAESSGLTGEVGQVEQFIWECVKP